MKKLSIVMLCALFFVGCDKDDENIPETPQYIIPENDVNSVKERIDLEENQELVTYSIIGKDSIWGLSRGVDEK